MQALRHAGLLDSPAEERSNRLNRLAQQLLGAPIALVSLVDTDRQWFKSHQDMDACEAARYLFLWSWLDVACEQA